MVNCAVINCKNCTNGRRKNQENVSFHRFPHEPNLKRKWIEATGNKDWSPTKHSTICSKHFEEASFVEGKKQRILANAAYPTVDVLKITTEEVSLFIYLLT
ncbi:hypothetical protein PYW08_012725 [Mythimna loreyi]|uniref:Uncharacterized protein n=1 Tax=Mythimna loreyi TaxID=667449 RepID=A0ACC2Q3E9_9NEOP|nr:hypothetical protein PYW08_012725 [Mythimna loreyi]